MRRFEEAEITVMTFENDVIATSSNNNSCVHAYGCPGDSPCVADCDRNWE